MALAQIVVIARTNYQYFSSPEGLQSQLNAHNAVLRSREILAKNILRTSSTLIVTEAANSNDTSSDVDRIETFRNACMDLESYFYINAQKLLEHFLSDSLLQDVQDIPCL